MEKEIKYCVVKFDVLKFKISREDKIYKYKIISVKEYRDKYIISDGLDK